MASDITVEALQTEDNISKSNLEFQDVFEEMKEETSMPKKKPRRVLHFSDGVLEEYSTDEEDKVEPKIISENVTQLATTDPSSLTWGPWFYYQTLLIGTKTLEVCDYLGESLANFFGITSPKYQFEINHYNNMIEEEKQRQQEEDLEMGGWQNVKDENVINDAS